MEGKQKRLKQFTIKFERLKKIFNVDNDIVAQMQGVELPIMEGVGDKHRFIPINMEPIPQTKQKELEEWTKAKLQLLAQMDLHHISDNNVNSVHSIFQEVPGKSTIATTRLKLNDEILQKIELHDVTMDGEIVGCYLNVAEVVAMVVELHGLQHHKELTLCLHGDGVNLGKKKTLVGMHFSIMEEVKLEQGLEYIYPLGVFLIQEKRHQMQVLEPLLASLSSIQCTCVDRTQKKHKCSTQCGGGVELPTGKAAVKIHTSNDWKFNKILQGKISVV